MRCEPASERSTCFNCGRPAAAVWHAETAVRVCAACAVEVLPALIADAVFGDPANGTLDFQRHVTAVLAAYWKAVAARLATQTTRYRDTHPGQHHAPVD